MNIQPSENLLYPGLIEKGVLISKKERLLSKSFLSDKLEGYIDINISGGYIAAATAGLIFSSEPHIYFYLGGGIILPPGVLGAITYSKAQISPGYNIAGQGTYFISSQYGKAIGQLQTYLEIGAGYPPGIIRSIFYIWKLR